MKKIALLAGLAVVALWLTTTAHAQTSVVVVECVWKGQEYVATGVEVVGVPGLSIAAGQGCPEVLAAIYAHGNPRLEREGNAHQTEFRRHMYVFQGEFMNN